MRDRWESWLRYEDKEGVDGWIETPFGFRYRRQPRDAEQLRQLTEDFADKFSGTRNAWKPPLLPRERPKLKKWKFFCPKHGYTYGRSLYPRFGPRCQTCEFKGYLYNPSKPWSQQRLPLDPDSLPAEHRGILKGLYDE